MNQKEKVKTGVETISVAIQGGFGSFHEIAARGFFNGNNIEIRPCDTFEELFYQLAENSVDCGMVAIENSVAGSILPNYAKLRNSGLRVAGEIYLRIVQNLIALPGQTISDIREIHSHPVAIQQCNIFLEEMRRKGVKVVESIDTALSAKWIREEELYGIGAIASDKAAEMYKLQILSEGVEADKQNFTRFLLVSGNEKVLALDRIACQVADKALVCFSLPHKVGSLSQILSVLAYYQMNLTKIQSLPVVGKAWEYLFHIDLQFSDYHQYCQALNAIRPLTERLEILGEYKQGEMPDIEQ